MSVGVGVIFTLPVFKHSVMVSSLLTNYGVIEVSSALIEEDQERHLLVGQQYFIGATRWNPFNARACFYLGITYLRLGKDLTAASVWKECRGSYDWLLDRGDALFHQGRLESAVRIYETAIDVSPELGRAYERLGSIYEKQGKLERAGTNVSCRNEWSRRYHAS